MTGFPCGEEVLAAERQDVAALQKAVESYRDATAAALAACQRAHLAAAKSKQASNTPNIHFFTTVSGIH